MRLLRTDDGSTFSLVEFPADVPPYAILSHTWGADEDEVTFGDVIEAKNLHKPGYEKLYFCAKQAAEDGFRFFWVDTCCIDKSSSAELSESINSMFKWYRDAEKCYVLLADVSRDATLLAFQRSRWFARGWTLQELLAPKSLEFYSADGRYLGNKTTEMYSIHLATGIPYSALQGATLSAFGHDERLSWAEHRQTKRQEDAAYSLMGLFNVHMPLIYGEGGEKALSRLKHEIALSEEAGSRADWLYTFVREFLMYEPSLMESEWQREHSIRAVVNTIKVLCQICAPLAVMCCFLTISLIFHTLITTPFLAAVLFMCAPYPWVNIVRWRKTLLVGAAPLVFLSLVELLIRFLRRFYTGFTAPRE